MWGGVPLPVFILSELSLFGPPCCKFEECDSDCVQSRAFTTLFSRGPALV